MDGDAFRSLSGCVVVIAPYLFHIDLCMRDMGVGDGIQVSCTVPCTAGDGIAFYRVFFDGIGDCLSVFVLVQVVSILVGGKGVLPGGAAV